MAVALAAGSAGVGGIGGTRVGSASKSNGYVAAAGRYERLAKQLGPMEFGSEEMAKLVAEYAGVLNSAAESLRSLASALESNNTAEAERQNRELDRISAHERALVSRMDRLVRALVVAQERLAHGRVLFDQRARLGRDFLEANAEARREIVTQFVLGVFDGTEDAARGARGEGQRKLDRGAQRGRLFVGGDEQRRPASRRRRSRPGGRSWSWNG